MRLQLNYRNRKHRHGWAVVTGASSGIGREFARELARDGFAVALVARNRDALEELAAELSRSFAVICRVIPADLSEEKECRRVLWELGERQITVFVNNAGFGDCGFFPETDLDKDLSMIHVNVRAVHLLTKLVLRRMQQQGGGYLLNVASSAGLMPGGPFMAGYYASKAYVASLSRGIAEELRERKSPVYVGCLCPGPVRTNFDEVANVEFSLKGITPSHCVRYALRKMRRRQVVIVPTLTMKAVMLMEHILPGFLMLRGIAGQQRRKFVTPHGLTGRGE